jgi:predicted acetyltransferase
MANDLPRLLLATSLDPKLIEAVLEMNEEFGQTHEDHFRPEVRLETFQEFLLELRRKEHEETIDARFVPGSVYWLFDKNDRAIGEVRFRHYLNENLLQEGGHIGYTIRPSERRKGFGTLILRLILEIARERGYDRVLVTCDTDNLPSARIIVSNGGVLDGESVSQHSGKQVSRYWIDLGRRPS